MLPRRARTFAGHYQPHVPADLGFYDLRVPETRIEQARLAREAGIHGFCYYYYWFAGKRLLIRPLQETLESGEPDFPFCVCWANEDWTRAWDGKTSEVLIGQEHSEADSRDFIRGLFPFFRDPRYIRVKGRPLLLIYRIDIIPDLRATVDLWRRECADAGIADPYLVAVQSFGIGDPTPYGFDAAVEFPPHGTDMAWNCNARYRGQFLNPSFAGHIVDIRRVIEVSRRRELPSYRLFRGVMPAWDNTARRQDTGLIFVESSPERYEAWLREMVDQTRAATCGRRATGLHQCLERVGGRLSPGARSSATATPFSMRPAARSVADPGQWFRSPRQPTADPRPSTRL